METIGQRIRKRRKELQLTIKDIKEATGLSIGNISDLENDKYAPSVAALIPLSIALSISIDWIVTGREFQLSENNIAERASGGGAARDNLMPRDVELLAKFHQLGEREQGRVEGMIDALLMQQEEDSPQVNKGASSRSKSGDGREEAAARSESA